MKTMTACHRQQQEQQQHKQTLATTRQEQQQKCKKQGCENKNTTHQYSIIGTRRVGQQQG